MALTEKDMQIAMARLDKCTNMHGQPLSENARKLIWAMVEYPTRDNWTRCRSIYITPKRTLWQEVVDAIALPMMDVPDGQQVLAVLGRVTG